LIVVVSTQIALQVVSAEIESVATIIESVAGAVDSGAFPQEAKATVAMNAIAIITFFIN
jgi:hypothetical protein